MPAKSVAQQQAMAIAEHHPEKATGAAKEMAESMSKDTLHDFAATKTKGLPKHKHKKEASMNYLHGFMCGYLRKQAAELPVAIRKALVGNYGSNVSAGTGAIAGRMPLPEEAPMDNVDKDGLKQYTRGYTGPELEQRTAAYKKQNALTGALQRNNRIRQSAASDIAPGVKYGDKELEDFRANSPKFAARTPVSK